MKNGLVAVAGMLLGAMCLSAEEARPTNSVSVVLKTQDGSSIVGSPVKADIAIETAFGRVSLPFEILKCIECEPRTTNTLVHFGNGDRLSGKWQDEAFALKTAFGEQKVPLALLRSVVVRGEGVREGLILHYSFDAAEDGVVQDSSGKGNNGTVCGAKYCPDGKVGGAYQVGKRLGYIQVPDQPAWSFADKRFSIGLWLRVNGLPYGEQMIIAHDDGGGERNKWAFEFWNGGLCFHINTPNSASYRIAANQWVPQVGKWHHLAVTRDGSAYSIYVDGACVSTENNQLPMPVANAPITIGQGEGLYVEGTIDEVMIFDRALTQEDIRQLYDAGK